MFIFAEVFRKRGYIWVLQKRKWKIAYSRIWLSLGFWQTSTGKIEYALRVAVKSILNSGDFWKMIDDEDIESRKNGYY